jgi:hypothetical protein
VQKLSTVLDVPIQPRATDQVVVLGRKLLQHVHTIQLENALVIQRNVRKVQRVVMLLKVKTPINPIDLIA